MFQLANRAPIRVGFSGHKGDAPWDFLATDFCV